MLINASEVAAVMLANRWVTVVEGTFEVCAREWFRPEASEEHWSFMFKNEQGEWLAGPLDSIQAAKSAAMSAAVPMADVVTRQRPGLGLRAAR